MSFIITKRKIKEWVYSRFALVSLLILVGLMLFPVWNMYKNYSESESMLSGSVAKMEELKEEKYELEKELDYLESDLGREAEIRKRFRTGKEGEVMAVIVEEEEGTQDGTEEEKKGTWDRFSGWVKGLFN
ncbi:MAG: hypothetical protein ACQEP6_01230 [Patescibacteria group bacterium]